jgi:hypothetical protein
VWSIVIQSIDQNRWKDCIATEVASEVSGCNSCKSGTGNNTNTTDLWRRNNIVLYRIGALSIISQESDAILYDIILYYIILYYNNVICAVGSFVVSIDIVLSECDMTGRLGQKEYI